LANVLRSNLYRLAYNTPKLAERIDVAAMDAVGAKLYSAEFGKPTFASREEISSLLKSAARDVDGLSGNTSFLLSEWDDVVDTWQLESWDEYRDAKRLGRKTRLPEAQRALYWQVFTKVKEHLRQTGKITTAEMFRKLAEVMPKRKHPVFDYIIVDEAQDIGVQQLRFLASIASDRSNGLFFSGDLGQRIFQQPFSWKSLGVDVRGRARTLTINYRTSHQIRSQADRLLGPEVSDVDGNLESRKGTISVFNGPEPVIRSFDGPDLESQAVGQWLKESGTGGVLPHEIGVFVRSEEEFPRARAAIEASGLRARVLGKDMATEEGFVSITTMHLAKGMEFRVVAVMACDEDIIPYQRRIDMASDDAELTEIYNTERHLLYVACTRARDLLHVSAIKPGSEFLQDLMQR
jgi:superfamily I DNA/RNA helicase